LFLPLTATVNLGKWILRYLFDNLIEEEIQRDEEYRKQLFDSKHPGSQKAAIPGPIKIPQPMMTSWLDTSSTPNSASTLKPANGYKFPQTPGLAIGFATPGPIPPMPPLLPVDETAQHESNSSRDSSERHSTDYFNAKPPTGTAPVTPGPMTPGPMTQGVNGTLPSEHATPTPLPPASPEPDPTTTSPEKTGLFSKKFMRMNLIPKSLKKAEKPAEPKTPAPQEQTSDNDSRNSQAQEKPEEESFLGSVVRARQLYDDQSRQSSERENGVLSVATANSENEPPRIAATSISPSLPNETPVLKPPGQTIILIQEDNVDSGGVADLWEGTVATVGRDADIVERVAPAWLADVLLKNLIPQKDIVKVSFVLEPWQNLLPPVSSEGNTRLNANRMLRAKKILAYVAERIEPAPKEDENVMKPEEYLELYCHDQVLHPQGWLAADAYSSFRLQ
jgi:WD repeat-containing protein 48